MSVRVREETSSPKMIIDACFKFRERPKLRIKLVLINQEWIILKLHEEAAFLCPHDLVDLRSGNSDTVLSEQSNKYPTT